MMSAHVSGGRNGIAWDDIRVPPPRRQTTAENERIAVRLSGQFIALVRYYLLRSAAVRSTGTQPIARRQR